MKNKHLFYLLQVIQKKGDIRRLVHEGLNYKQIGELTNNALETDLITFNSSGNLELTDLGHVTYLDDEKLFKKLIKDQWIQPDLKSKIRQIDKDDIYLPRENDLSF